MLGTWEQQHKYKYKEGSEGGTTTRFYNALMMGKTDNMDIPTVNEVLSIGGGGGGVGELPLS